MPTLEHGSTIAASVRDRAGGWVWVAALLDLVFPPFCPVCQRRLGEGRRDPLCGVCWEALDRIVPPCCRVCGLPLSRPPSPDAAPSSGMGALCGRCRRRPPPFVYARAAVRYDEVAREAVHAFKFGGRRALADPLAALVAGVGPAGLPGGAPDLLVPVPLHPQRERERGFNQALLLARRLGHAWSVPVCADALARTRATGPQTELSAEARRANVRGAFAVRRPERVAGRYVALVDDVFTTGSTVTACARCLLDGGASTVGVLTVARAI